MGMGGWKSLDCLPPSPNGGWFWTCRDHCPVEALAILRDPRQSTYHSQPSTSYPHIHTRPPHQHLQPNAPTLWPSDSSGLNRNLTPETCLYPDWQRPPTGSPGRKPAAAGGSPQTPLRRLCSPYSSEKSCCPDLTLDGETEDGKGTTQSGASETLEWGHR